MGIDFIWFKIDKFEYLDKILFLFYKYVRIMPTKRPYWLLEGAQKEKHKNVN